MLGRATRNGLRRRCDAAVAGALVVVVALAAAPGARADAIQLRPVFEQPGQLDFEVTADHLSRAYRARLVLGSRHVSVPLRRLRRDAARGRLTRLRLPRSAFRGVPTLRIRRDTTPPSAPANLKLTVSGDTATLRWKPSSDDRAVARYLVSVGGRVLAILPATRLSHGLPLVVARSGVVTVRARDRAGNLSALSEAARISLPGAGAPGAASGFAAGPATDTWSEPAAEPPREPAGPAPPEPEPEPLPGPPPVPVERGTLLWSDEFAGAANSRPGGWTAAEGGHGWGNGELQQFTGRTSNASLDGSGNLVITARRERYTGADGRTRDYTSARLSTDGRFSFTYGHLEARMRIPAGQGLWSAFWAMGDDVRRLGWPAGGEFDVVEILGQRPDRAYGHLHGPVGTTQTHWAAGVGHTAPSSLAGGFHVYGVTWGPEGFSWSVDDVIYASLPRSGLPTGARWVFDRPFHPVLSLSVGGSWPGAPDASTVFPARLLVDWVRVSRLPPGATGLPRG